MTRVSRVVAIPYLTCRGAAKALEFYVRAFDAVEVRRMAEPDGKVAHAEIAIGGAPIYISDEYPEHDALSPESIGRSATMVVLLVPDADDRFTRAVAAGATVLRPMQDQLGGTARNGKLRDPYGHHWMLYTERRSMM